MKDLYISVTETAVMVKGFDRFTNSPEHTQGLLPVKEQHITLIGRRLLEQLPPDTVKRTRSTDWKSIEVPEPVTVAAFRAIDGEKESAGILLNNQADYRVIRNHLIARTPEAQEAFETIRDHLARTPKAQEGFNDSQVFHVTTHTKTGEPRDAVSNVSWSDGIYKFVSHHKAMEEAS